MEDYTQGTFSHFPVTLSLSLSRVVSFLNSWLSSARREIGFKRAPAVGCGNTKEAAQERRLMESSVTFLSSLQPSKRKENFHTADCCCGVVETSKKKKKGKSSIQVEERRRVCCQSGPVWGVRRVEIK